jgi:hypothetical protein
MRSISLSKSQSWTGCTVPSYPTEIARPFDLADRCMEKAAVSNAQKIVASMLATRSLTNAGGRAPAPVQRTRSRTARGVGRCDGRVLLSAGDDGSALPRSLVARWRWCQPHAATPFKSWGTFWRAPFRLTSLVVRDAPAARSASNCRDLVEVCNLFDKMND